MADLPELKKGGLIRRGLALVVDLLVLEVLIQLIAILVYPLSGGALIDSKSLYTACEPATSPPAGVVLPPGFDPTSSQLCVKGLPGWPTARLFVASHQDAGSRVVTSLSYAVGPRGNLVAIFDLAGLQLLGLVVLRWLLERRGRRSLGRIWLSLAVLPRLTDPSAAETRSAIDRRYLLYGLPLLPGLLVSLASFAGQLGGKTLPPEVASEVTFLSNLPLTVALFAAASAVVRGRDAYYDGSARTVVARLVEGQLEVAPERPARLGWLRRGGGGQHPVPRPAFPWVSCGLAVLLTVIYAAEVGWSYRTSHLIGVTGTTRVQFGAMSGELVRQIGQWYRLVTAMFLHISAPHLVGNVAVLLAAGWFLEGLFGPGWFLATFLLGGLAGALASVMVNPPVTVSLGASGAVTAVLAAGLALSAGLADDSRRLWLRAFCSACLLAALQAAGTFSWGTIDRADHFGGAAGGLLIGASMLSIRRRRAAPQPPWQRAAPAFALAVCASLFVSVPLAGFGDAPLSALLIPPDLLPKTDADWMNRAEALARRYPSDPRVHVALAMAAGGDRTVREAEMSRTIATQLRLTPGNRSKIEESVDMSVGAARATAQDWPAVQDLFGRAIAAAPPGNPEAFAKRGEAEEHLGQFDAALQDLRTLAGLQPKRASIHIDLSDALFMMGRSEQALAEIGTALELAPDDTLALRQRGWIGFFAKSKAAVADLERAAQLRPKDAYAALWLDIVAVRSGEADRIGAIVAGLDTSVWPGPVVKLYLGQIGVNAMMAGAADSDATRQAEQHCEADFYYGEWEIMQREPAEAEPFLKEAVATCPKTFYEWAAAQAELSGAAGYRPE